LAQQTQGIGVDDRAKRAHEVRMFAMSSASDDAISLNVGAGLDVQTALTSQNQESRFAKISPSRVQPMEKAMQKFVASFESYAAAKVEAKANGWDGESEGMLDYLDGHHPQESRAFPNQGLALKWLLDNINDGKSLFGCGDIDVMKKVEPRQRCRYCTCRGWLNVQSFLVDDTGVTEQRELSEECWDGED